MDTDVDTMISAGHGVQEVPGHCYFLNRLPKELRNMIYPNVSTDRKLPVYDDSCHDVALLDAPQESLTLVNHQIHDEYLDTIASRSTLVVDFGVYEAGWMSRLHLDRQAGAAQDFEVLKHVQSIKLYASCLHAFSIDEDYGCKWTLLFSRGRVTLKHQPKLEDGLPYETPSEGAEFFADLYSLHKLTE